MVGQRDGGTKGWWAKGTVGPKGRWSQRVGGPKRQRANITDVPKGNLEESEVVDGAMHIVAKVNAPPNACDKVRISTRQATLLRADRFCTLFTIIAA